MIINKEFEKFNKELEKSRGFKEKEWEELDYNLKMLIACKGHISGQGSALFKHIINVLVNFEKRLKAIENKTSELNKIKIGGTD